VAHGLEAIDWQVPWLAPIANIGQQGVAFAANGLAVCDALNRVAVQATPSPQNLPVNFVAQTELPADQAYEDFIFKTGQVPTRNNLHDFFNGLAWIHFPQTKKRLNQLQAEQISQVGIGQVRGPVRDALTVFDENAAFLQAPQVLWDALVAKDWQKLFVDLRPLWQDARLVLFGHALLEKLVHPRKAVTAHVYQAQTAIKNIANNFSLTDLDTWVAADLSVEKLAEKPFAHLPILGVPGWCKDNEAPGFYDDASVFRVKKYPHAIQVNS
jgi:Protein of unknown function (DUF3025)